MNLFDEQTERNSLQGVRGWLFLFAIGLVAIAPVLTIINVATLYSSFREIRYFMRTPAVLETILSILLTAFGFYAGAALLTRTDPSAVKITKLYLLAAVISRVIIAIIYYAATDDWQRKYMPPTITWSLFLTPVAAYLWFSYFNQSKRVRATYYSQDSTDPEMA